MPLVWIYQNYVEIGLTIYFLNIQLFNYLRFFLFLSFSLFWVTAMYEPLPTIYVSGSLWFKFFFLRSPFLQFIHLRLGRSFFLSPCISISVVFLLTWSYPVLLKYLYHFNHFWIFLETSSSFNVTLHLSRSVNCLVNFALHSHWHHQFAYHTRNFLPVVQATPIPKLHFFFHFRCLV